MEVRSSIINFTVIYVWNDRFSFRGMSFEDLFQSHFFVHFSAQLMASFMSPPSLKIDIPSRIQIRIWYYSTFLGQYLVTSVANLYSLTFLSQTCEIWPISFMKSRNKFSRKRKWIKYEYKLRVQCFSLLQW